MSWWVATTSVAWRPPSIQTTALPSIGEGMGLFGGEAFGVSELLGDRLVAIELFDIGG